MPRITLEPRFQVEHLSVLDSEGNLDTALEPKLSADELKSLYRAMVLGRRLDERMVRLQRQGRIGTFAPIKGQEASQMGTAFTLRKADWMVPSFREIAAMIWRPRTTSTTCRSRSRSRPSCRTRSVSPMRPSTAATTWSSWRTSATARRPRAISTRR
jgi:TPP-dependent pyruvate/acetoin dehydrogenase alpha subunit